MVGRNHKSSMQRIYSPPQQRAVVLKVWLGTLGIPKILLKVCEAKLFS